SDCNIGPLGAAAPEDPGFATLGAAPGTSLGGRRIGVPPKSCAAASLGNAPRPAQSATAWMVNTCWPSFAPLLPPKPMGRFSSLIAANSSQTQLFVTSAGVWYARSKHRGKSTMPDSPQLLRSRRSTKPVELVGPAPSALEIDT